MMTYEAWRIAYQSSEQAARAAYQEVERLRAELAAREWRTIDENTPWDTLILVGPTKRMGICVAMHDSRDGWVTETCAEWVSMYTPTHWMPLPPEPKP